MSDRTAFNQPYVDEIVKLRSAIDLLLLDEAQAETAHSILDQMRAIYESKDQDYAGSGKPMQNLRGSEDFGIEAWRGVLLRMADKRQRIMTFYDCGTYKVESESVQDTLLDLCNYAVLCKLLYAERAGVDLRVPDSLTRISLNSLLMLVDPSSDSTYFARLNEAFDEIKAIARRGMQGS